MNSAHSAATLMCAAGHTTDIQQLSKNLLKGSACTAIKLRRDKISSPFVWQGELPHGLGSGSFGALHGHEVGHVGQDRLQVGHLRQVVQERAGW